MLAGDLIEVKTISRNAMFWFFLAVFFISMYLVWILFRPFLSVIVIGAVATGICAPFYKFLNKRFSNLFASFLTCLLLFIALFIPIILCVGILSKETYDLYLSAKNAVLNDHLKVLLENNDILYKVNYFLSKFNIELTSEDFSKTFSEVGTQIGFFLYKQIGAIASNMFLFIINFCMMLLVVFFLLIDGERLLNFIIDLSPLPPDHDKKLIQKFKDIAGAILIGNGIGGLIQGIAGGIVFALFGLKSPLLWGLIMAFLAFLPIFGIGLILIPASFYLAIQGRFGASIFFIIFYLILSGGIEYIFKPKLVGKRVRMHTLMVFFSIIGGIKMFGLLGIIYGPLVITAFLTLTDMYHSSYRKMIESDYT